MKVYVRKYVATDTLQELPDHWFDSFKGVIKLKSDIYDTIAENPMLVGVSSDELLSGIYTENGKKSINCFEFD